MALDHFKMSGPSPQIAEPEEKYHRSYLGLQTMNPNCSWDGELPRADCVVCYSKKSSHFRGFGKKKRKKRNGALCHGIFSTLPKTHMFPSPYKLLNSIYPLFDIIRQLKAYLYEFSITPPVTTCHDTSTHRESRLSWWHWLILLLRVPFSCLVLIECNSLLVPLHQIRQWSLRWPAGAQRWG